MLVTVRTRAYANITMFGDVATELLKLMGLSGKVTLSQRAVPLLELLRAAAANEADVLWDS
jgi:hypothetical protein